MKDLDYYNNTELCYPKREDYVTYFVYNKGECLFMGDKEGFHAYSKKEGLEDKVTQKLLDKKQYNEDRAAYNAEKQALMEEFQRDLFREYDVQSNPKRYKCYDMAWERGHSAGLYEVVGNFSDLVELIQ